MKKDKLVLYLLEIVLIIVLFLALFVSSIFNYRILALALALLAIIINFFIRKKMNASYYKKQVTWLMIAMAIIYLLAFYTMGIYFGFYRSSTIFSWNNTWAFIVPFTVIIVASELIRNKFLTQTGKLSRALTFIGMVLIDLVVYSRVYNLNQLDDVLTIIGFILFASIACNLLYNYIAIRYGIKPVIAYRLITILYQFFIPYIPDIYIFFRSFLRMLYPYIIYIVLEYTYARTHKATAYKDKTRSAVETSILLVLMMILIGLISCKFEFGILVVGSGSMTGTIDKGDTVFFQKYHDEPLEEGTVIIFNHDNIQTIHRVVKAENVNGEFRYYTKGDANKEQDEGYVVKNNVVGIIKFKIKYIGWPTIWVRDLFNEK